MSDSMKPILAKVADGSALSEQESETAFEIIMSGEATAAQIGGFLMALRVRGETVAEITGAARIMRAKALKVSAPDDAIDIVGTGGDASGTYNISTGTALVVAGCGIPIAKHGNKALSSKSGTADVQSALGVNIMAEKNIVEKCIVEAGIGFLMAPLYHSAMKHVGPARVELGTRTIFNLLGPLSNPADVKRQMTGSFSQQWIVPMAETLGKLGCEHAWVVHGSDGLDEITTTGATYVAELKGGNVSTFEITPEDAGLPRAEAKDLKGGSPQNNAKAMLALLAGEKGAFRDVVLINAAASLIIAGRANDLKAGVALAEDAIDSGKAKAVLDKLIAITNE